MNKFVHTFRSPRKNPAVYQSRTQGPQALLIGFHFEPSGFMASDWSPGEIKFKLFIKFLNVSSGDQPLAKEHEDSGYDEIGCVQATANQTNHDAIPAEKPNTETKNASKSYCAEIKFNFEYCVTRMNKL